MTLILGTVFLTAGAQKVEIVKYDQVETLMKKSGSNLKIFNFWATWCGPCIKELPYFESANQKENVEVYLVSLDFPEDAEKVKRFVAKKNLKSTTFLLDEKNYDSYMGRVSNDWSGAIPATLFVDGNGKRYFYETPFNESELEKKISEDLN